MTQTDKTAAQVIVDVMNDVQAVAKRDRNTAQNFNFRGIDAVVNAIGPALRKHGGFIVPRVVNVRNETAAAKSGGSLNVVRVEVEYSVHGTIGEPVSGWVAAEAFDSGDKATAKAMSVAYRTFMLQLFCLPTDEPDPDSFSYEIGEKVPARDWKAEVAALSTVEQARALWREAVDAKATKSVTDAIEAKVASLG
jgi:hypothetical protein